MGRAASASLSALGAECHVAGDTVRMIVAEAQQDAALEALRRDRVRLISVTPVRMSLEDYFMTQLGSREDAAAKYSSSKARGANS